MSAADKQPLFRPIIRADEIHEDQITAVTLDGRSVLLTRLDGRVQAVDGRCPHAGADLCQGRLYRGRLDCPNHDYRFDVRSGRILWPPDEVYRLKKLSVREEEGWILLQDN